MKTLARSLLSFTTVQAGCNVSSALHKDMLHEALHFYKNDFSNILCLIGNNFFTNSCLARKSKLYSDDCASCHLNLGSRIIMKSYEVLLSKIRGIVQYLRGLKLQAAFRQMSNFALFYPTLLDDYPSRVRSIAIHSRSLLCPALFLLKCSFCRPKTVWC